MIALEEPDKPCVALALFISQSIRFPSFHDFPMLRKRATHSTPGVASELVYQHRYLKRKRVRWRAQISR